MNSMQIPLVHIRTPTYKRGQELERCLKSLQKQTWQNWVCDVYDDDPEGSAQLTCDRIQDERIFYTQNNPQKFASRNIDACFSMHNPHQADYFAVVEDDNFLLPEFMEENIKICMRERVNLVLRNQLIEFATATPDARVSSFGILDSSLVEKQYMPDEFHLSLISGIGVSNGGLFWSSVLKNSLEIGYDCTATLQEYMRTFSVAEPIFVAMKPLAVWAENGEDTLRDIGSTGSYLRKELDAKRAIQILQRQAWKQANAEMKDTYLQSDAFAFSRTKRAAGLLKSLNDLSVLTELPFRQTVELILRGTLIRLAGRTSGDFQDFVASRGRA
ncbi:MAG: glycosyltransferase family A protein [Hyphomicrobiales bacterium]